MKRWADWSQRTKKRPTQQACSLKMALLESKSYQKSQLVVLAVHWKWLCCKSKVIVYLLGKRIAITGQPATQALPSPIINLTPNQTTSAQRYTPNTAEYIIPSKYHTANTVAQLRAQRGGARGGETAFATLSASPPRKFPLLKKQHQTKKTKKFPTKNLISQRRPQ